MARILVLLALVLLAALPPSRGSEDESKIHGFFRKSGHTNNWAVIVNTSRFWFNYRHGANVLSIYRTVKRLGIPDSHIIMMMADDFACNPRNSYPGQIFNSLSHKINLYGENIEIDYRGYDVTVENFIRVLTDRVGDDVPLSKRLLSDDRSNILIYMTGHGGEEFLKFQDSTELSSRDLADAFEQMHQKRRYHEIFFMIDTCQASTMHSRIYSPNILAVGSALIGENSYSHENDKQVGVTLIDRFTYYNLETLEKINQKSEKTMAELFSTYNPPLLHSTPGIRVDLMQRPINKILITDFFGSVQGIELTSEVYPLVPQERRGEESQGGGGGAEKTGATPQEGKPKHNSPQFRQRSLYDEGGLFPTGFTFGMAVLLLLAIVVSLY